jgi:hypothetical protein
LTGGRWAAFLFFVTRLLLSSAILVAMESTSSPAIASFVIRFVVDEIAPCKESQPCYRGAIRHIQSDEEMSFSAWEDAVEFIRRYVPLEVESGQGNT